uniref:G_PROTEIN_RECEP_F1_2 domain-containing protein n=1 Tax=Haemonchus contortus TaxID=6289 RepID=A0A7I4YPK7_HAECO
MFNVPQTVVEVTLALIYLFVLFIIITSKKEVFKNVFYMMFVATGFADVTSISLCCFFRINSQLQGGPQMKPFISAGAVIAGTAFVAHMIGNLIITINRFSVLCLRKDRFWSRRNVRIIICVQYACAFAALVPAIGVDLIYAKNENGSYILMGMHKQDDLINRCAYVGTSLIYAVISFILNIRLLAYLHRMMKLSDSSRLAGHEKGMVFCTLIVFAFTMLMCTQQTLRGIAVWTENTEFNNWISMHYYWINDVMVSIPPSTQLILNSELRRDIINSFRCRRHRSNNVTNAIMFSSQQHGLDRSSYHSRRSDTSIKY